MLQKSGSVPEAMGCTAWGGRCSRAETQDCPPGVPLQGGTVRLSIAACHFCGVAVLSHVLDVLVCPKGEVILLDSVQQEVLGITSYLNSQGRCFSFT